jgi:hypothetical protein
MVVQTPGGASEPQTPLRSPPTLPWTEPWAALTSESGIVSSATLAPENMLTPEFLKVVLEVGEVALKVVDHIGHFAWTELVGPY